MKERLKSFVTVHTQDNLINDKKDVTYTSLIIMEKDK